MKYVVVRLAKKNQKKDNAIFGVINGILDSLAINQFPKDNSKKKASLNLRTTMFKWSQWVNHLADYRLDK